jgi:hypothetical protein
MTEYFAPLSESEYEKLKDSIALITILIAGADGKFDQKELDWAEKVATIRSYKMYEDLKGFYKDVGEDFHDKLIEYIDAFPKNVHDRTHIISDRLGGLNDILAKLDVKVGAHMYSSLKSFAKHVASAHGGIFGFFSIGPKEDNLMNLEMIKPIVYEEESND